MGTWKVVGGKSLELEKLHSSFWIRKNRGIRPNTLNFCNIFKNKPPNSKP